MDLKRFLRHDGAPMMNPHRPLLTALYRTSYWLIAGVFWLSVSVAQAAPNEAVTIGYAEAESVALKHNAQIQNAQAALEGARADILTAGARPNAVMSVNASGVDKSQYQYGARLNAVDTIVRIDDTGTNFCPSIFTSLR